MKVNVQYMYVVCGICMLWKVGAFVTTGVTWKAVTVISLSCSFFIDSIKSTDNQSRRGDCRVCSASVLIAQKWIPRINSLHFSLLLLNSCPLLYICSFPCTHVVYENVGDTEHMGLEWDAVVDR